MKYVIFTDSTSDLTTDECKNIGLWPEMFMQEITCYGHPIDYSDVEQFYKRMADGEFPAGELKTASGSADGFTTILDHIIEKTDPEAAIVYASTSPFISEGTLTIGTTTMQDYQEKYPNRKFIHINSHSVSGGQAVFLRYLAKYGGEDIVEYANELSKHCIHLFTLRDFRYTRTSS